MIPRYTRAEMGALWTEANKFQSWLRVEIAACEVHAERGTIPAGAMKVIRERARIDVSRIEEIEKNVGHDIIAFTTALAETIGPESRFVHYGLTSSDVVDTANALRLKRAGELLLGDLEMLLEVLRRRAFELKDVAMIGRTHGMHAEPTTFGLKCALWYADAIRNRSRLRTATESVSYGKLSGAVGTFAHMDPEVEAAVCQRLGLKPAPISTQIIQRDRYAEFVCALAVIAGSLEKIALEIRHLQRSEVREAAEHFSETQKGSSAMPHKRNPITCEQICGLARVVRSHAQVALENIALWHERDISHSSAERVILPDACILTDYLLNKTTNLIDRLVVYPDQMRANLNASGGLIFSGPLLLELTRRGMAREDAYSLVQRHANTIWEQGGDFRKAIENDPAIVDHLPAGELDLIFDAGRYLTNVDHIFARVFTYVP
ncbi:MAG: adenylosuccinate lyase [Acidobacteria bacterium]|nr:adenylosuccinate lyase [Acidobacteriota bacterium]